MSNARLVDPPTDETVTLDEFISSQQSHIQEQAGKMTINSQNVQHAIDDLFKLVQVDESDGMEVKIPEDQLSNVKHHYAKLMYQAILSATQRSLNVLKKRLAAGMSAGFLFVDRPFFDVDVELTVPVVSMNPSLEDIQSTVNNTAKQILSCSKALTLWGNYIVGATGTFFDLIAADKSIVKSLLLLTGCVECTKASVLEYLDTFAIYDFLWKRDMQQEYQEFIKGKPNIDSFEAELKKYMTIEQDIAKIAPVHNIGCLSMETQSLKYSLKAEAAAWKAQYAKNLHSQGREDLYNFMEYIRETTMKLNRKMEDLEDVRYIMNILSELRSKEAEIDSVMSPIEDMYSLLLRYEVQVPKEETDMLSDMFYAWKKLRKLQSDVSEKLNRYQAKFKKELVKEVKLFVADAISFRNDWETNGPITPGLDPMEAHDRLEKFQGYFSLRKQKWDKYVQGEILFGLPVTQYAELVQTEKEIGMLDRLYSLYVEVIKTLDSYSDYLWVSVIENIDSMISQTNEFNTKCKKLPKALKEWQAYTDCKKKIDDFTGLLPILELLTGKSIRLRHWQELMSVTGTNFSLAEDALKVANLFNDEVLSHIDEIEEIASAASKEEQIEIKLSQISEEWSDMQFSFAEYKKRGPVILQSSDLGVRRLLKSLRTLRWPWPVWPQTATVSHSRMRSRAGSRNCPQ